MEFYLEYLCSTVAGGIAPDIGFKRVYYEDIIPALL